MARKIDFNQCESPIEQLFLEELDSRLHKDVEVFLQAETPTHPKYRVDILALHLDRKVIIECDGRVFHDYENDQNRDTNILSNTQVTDVIRIWGKEINFSVDTAIEFVSKCVPELLSDDSIRPSITELFQLGSYCACGPDSPTYRTMIPFSELSHLAGLASGRAYGFQVIAKVGSMVVVQIRGPEIKIKRIDKRHSGFPMADELSRSFRAV